MKYQNKAFYPETPWHLIRVLWCILTLMVDMFVLTNTYPEGETAHSWTFVSEKSLRCWSHPWESAGNSRFQRALQHQSTDARQRAGTGVSGRGWYTGTVLKRPSRDDWAVESRLADLFVPYTSSETKTKWWNLEIFPGFGCDSWPRLQGPRMGSMKTKLRAHADSLIGSVNEATSLEIGSVHKILVKFGSI